MNVGIELLIKRIKDRPDEFVGGDWNRLMDLYSNFITVFTDEENKAVDDALQEAKREVFIGKVMEVIANNEVAGEFVEKYIPQSKPSKITLSRSAATAIMNNPISNAFQIGKETLTEQNLIDIKKKLANLK